VRAPSSDRFVRHCVESPALAPAGALARTGHREDSFSPFEEPPGPEMGVIGVADE
jgi:hypothetical protein